MSDLQMIDPGLKTGGRRVCLPLQKNVSSLAFKRVIYKPNIVYELHDSLGKFIFFCNNNNQLLRYCHFLLEHICTMRLPFFIQTPALL